MKNLFLNVLNLSLTGGFVILIVISARFFLKKAPKIFSYILWAFVFIRLVMPFSIESNFSLIEKENLNFEIEENFETKEDRKKDFAIEENKEILKLPKEKAELSYSKTYVDKKIDFIKIFSFVWIFGIFVLGTKSVVQFLSFKKNLNVKKHLKENIYAVKNLDNAFVIGIFSPKIYVPENLKKDELKYIVCHENIHIERFDYLIKLISFMIVILHWFNPLVWIAFNLMEKDMELSCDEKVIKKFGSDCKKDYSTSLLNISSEKNFSYCAPISFSDSHTKSRIKNILNYKKPKFFISLVVLLLVIAIGCTTLTNKPKKEADGKNIEDFAKNYIDEQVSQVEKYGYKITSKKIVSLEKTLTLTNILENPVDIYKLDYRLKYENNDKGTPPGYFEKNDYIIEDKNAGEGVYFAVERENNTVKRIFEIENKTGMNKLSEQEIALRIYLENNGEIPAITWPHNNVVASFADSNGKVWKLLLSNVDPASTEYTVERIMDDNKNIFHVVPHVSKDVTLSEYARTLRGHDSYQMVARDFIKLDLKFSDIKNFMIYYKENANLEDFLNDMPVYYLGYLKSDSKDTLELDQVEYIIISDTLRIEELGLNINKFDGISYIYNKNDSTKKLNLKDDTLFLRENEEGKAEFYEREPAFTSIIPSILSIDCYDFINRDEFINFLKENPDKIFKVLVKGDNTECIRSMIYTKDNRMGEVLYGGMLPYPEDVEMLNKYKRLKDLSSAGEYKFY